MNVIYDPDTNVFCVLIPADKVFDAADNSGIKDAKTIEDVMSGLVFHRWNSPEIEIRVQAADRTPLVFPAWVHADDHDKSEGHFDHIAM